MARSAHPPHDGDSSELGSRREARTELLDELLDGQRLLTEQELEQARREWEDAVREELSGLFEEMDAGEAIPTTDEDFARMVHQRASKHSGQ